MIVDKPQKAILLLEHVERKETPGLKLIILMEPFDDALKERGQKCGVNIKSMQAVEVRLGIEDVCWVRAGWLPSHSIGHPPLSCLGAAVLGPSDTSVARQGRLARNRGGRPGVGAYRHPLD